MAKFNNLERCRKITYDFCNYKISWKLSVIEKISHLFLKLISTNVQKSGTFFQIIVAFSEYLNVI